MTVYDWDSQLRFQAISAELRGQVIGGPPALLGRRQTASLDAGYWIISFRGIVVNRPERVRAYRSLRAKLQGGTHEVRAPVCDRANLIAGAAATTNAIAAAGTTLVPVASATGIEGGEYFTPTGQDRLYIVREVFVDIDDSLALVVSPRLREAIPNATVLNFQSPVCRSRMIDEATGDLTLEHFRRGFPDMVFVEAN